MQSSDVLWTDPVNRMIRPHGMQCVERGILSLCQSKGGFIEGTPDDLPPPRRERYEQSRRNSKVLPKQLAWPRAPDRDPYDEHLTASVESAFDGMRYRSNPARDVMPEEVTRRSLKQPERSRPADQHEHPHPLETAYEVSRADGLHDWGKSHSSRALPPAGPEMVRRQV